MRLAPHYKKIATSVPLIINEMKKRGVEVINLGLSPAEHQLYKSICKLRNPGSIYRRVGKHRNLFSFACYEL